jgi:hypothetical protein
MQYCPSKHFSKRVQQRSIRDFVVNYLLIYGSSSRAGRDCESVYFDKIALSEIEAIDPEIYKKIEKYKNSYIIVSADGKLITAARIH